MRSLQIPLLPEIHVELVNYKDNCDVDYNNFIIDYTNYKLFI